MKKTTTRIAAILIAIVMLIGCSVGIISASAAPGYNSGLVNSMKEAMKNYEDKMKNGIVYVDKITVGTEEKPVMSTAYEYYVEVSRYLDRYYYANENLNQTYINQAINSLNSAVSKMNTPFTPYTANNPDPVDGSYTKSSLINNATISFTDGASESGQTDELSGTIVTYGVGNLAPYQGGSSPNNGKMSIGIQFGAVVFLYSGPGNYAVPITAYHSKGNNGTETRPRYLYPTSPAGIGLKHFWHGPGQSDRTAGYKNQVSDGMAYSYRTDRAAIGSGTTLTKTYTNYLSNTLYYIGSPSNLYLDSITTTTWTSEDNRSNPVTFSHTDSATHDSGSTSGNPGIYILNYKTLLNAIDNAKSYLPNVSNYKEGGLAALMTAFDNATSYNPNNDFSSVTLSNFSTALSTALSTAQSHLKNYTEALNKAPTADSKGYPALRTAIDAARALYYHTDTDTTTANGVNPTVTNANGASNLKYCTKEWEAFANLFATIADQRNTTRRTSGDAFMQDAADVGSTTYDNPSQAATYAQQLTAALAAVKEHVAGSDKLYKFPDEGGYKKANCEDNGLAVQYSKCPNCAEEYIDNNAYVITSTGHNPVAHEGNDEATCTKAGIDPYFQCIKEADDLHEAGCGKYFEDNDGVVGDEIDEPQSVDPLGHVLALYQSEREATCFVGALKEIWHCSRCDKYFTKENVSETSENYATPEDLQEGQPNPHEFVPHTPEEATCEHSGNLEYWSCANCSLMFHSAEASDVWNVETEGSPILPQLAHSFTAYEPNNDGSCVANETETAYCDYEKDQPKEEQASDTRIVKEAVGHVFGADSKTDRVIPDCINGGNVEYYTCEVCDGKYNTNNIWSVAEVPEDQLNIAATGVHSLVQHYAQTANCQSEGWNDYWECSVCKILYDSADQNTGNVIENLKEWEGYTEEGKGEHVLVPFAAQTATCLVDGWDAYWYCALCTNYYSDGDQSVGNDAFEANKIVVENNDITKWSGYHSHETANHNIGQDLATEANCMEPGYDTHYECSVCHKWFLDENGTEETDEKPIGEKNPDNHTGNWITNGVTPATCTETGFKVANVQCKDCGYYYADTEHTTVADRLTEDQLIAPTVDHDQKDKRATDIGSIAATCTAQGQQMYFLHCSMCGALQSATSEVTDKIPHEATTDEAIKGFAPTCQVAGEKDHFECKMCHQFFGDSTCAGDPIDIVIPTVPHDFSNHTAQYTVVVTAADCWNNAKVEYLCTFDCGTHSEAQESTDEGYAKLGHNFTDESSHAEKAATCLTDGNAEYYYCDRCDQNYSDNDDYTTNTFNGNLTTPATGHNFVIDKLGVAATCEKDGTYTSYVCNNENCDLTKEGVKAQFIYDADTKEYKAIADANELVESLNPANHTGLHGYATEPADCSTWKDGYDSYIYCSGCHNYYRAYDHYGEEPLENGKDDLKIDPVHTLEPYGENKPTCIEDGNIAVYVCSKCDAIFLDNTPTVQNGLSEDEIEEKVVVKAEGHTFGDYIVKEATCSVEGIAGHYECSVCNIAVICAEADKAKDSVKFYNGNDIDNLDLGKDDTNHKNIVDGESKSATCLEDGVKEHKVCEDCGTLFDVDGVTVIEDTTTPATGHSYELVTTDAKDATCMDKGVKAHYECANDYCDLTVDGTKARFLYNDETADYKAIEDDSELEIPKDSDNHVNLHYDPGTDAKCSPWTVGMRASINCDCGAYYELDDVNHTNAKSAEDFEITPQHSLEYREGQPQTCEVDGWNDYWECTVEGCGEKFLDNTPGVETGVDETDIKLEATSHKAGDVKIENENPGADCQHNGTYDEVVYCQNEWCDVEGGKELSRVNKTDVPGPHVPGEPQQEHVVPASCETSGSYDLVTRCTLCDTIIEEVKDQVIPATDHRWGDWEIVKSPDCVNDGSKRRECLNGCGLTQTEDLDPNGHDWEDDYTIDKDATCTVDGSKSIHCKNCDAQMNSETIPATGHTPGKAKQENRVEPTETKDGGYDLVVHCEVCGEILESTHVTLPATGSGEKPSEKPSETPSETPSQKPSEDPSETPSEDTSKNPSEDTTKAPGNGNGSGSNSGTSPNTGLAITIPVFSLAALAGGFFSLGYARKKKNEDEE